MKALSIREPWATLIVRHGKDCENRVWATGYRGPLLICASMQVERFDLDDWNDWVDAQGFGEKRPPSPLALGREVLPGHAVGVVDVVGCDEVMRGPWDAEGQFHIRLANPRALQRPFKVKGRLGFFEVDDALVSEALGGKAITEEERDMVAGFRKLTVLEQLEVQREYLEVLDEQKSYLQTWAVAKADHKTRMEEYEERLGDLLTSMRTGFAKPTQAELSLGDEGGSFDGKSYEEARAELVDAAVDRALGDAAPAEGGAKEEVKMPWLEPTAEQDASAAFWEQQRQDILVGMSPNEAVTLFGLGKQWCVRPEGLSALAERTGREKGLAAYHMGAHAKAAKMALTRNPFVAADTVDSEYHLSWRLGWARMGEIEGKLARLALAAGEARAAGVGEGGERDMRVGTPFEKDERVNCNGAFCKEAGTTAELEKKGVKAFVQVVDGRPSVEGWYVGMGIMGKYGGASVAPSIALAPHATRVEAVEHAAGWLRKAGTGLARAEFWREFEEWMVEVRALGATLEGAANG